MTGLPSCRTQQHKENHHYLLRSLPGQGKGNIKGHFTNLPHISIFFPALYFIVKARFILLFDGTWITNSAYLAGFSGRGNNIWVFLSTQKPNHLWEVPVSLPCFRKLMITLLLILLTCLRKKMNLDFKTPLLVFASQARHECALNERRSAVMCSREIACYIVGTECSGLPWV